MIYVTFTFSFFTFSSEHSKCVFTAKLIKVSQQKLFSAIMFGFTVLNIFISPPVIKTRKQKCLKTYWKMYMDNN